MFNLLIIDDEYHIVQGLAGSVEKEELEVDRIYTAYSVAQGRKIIETEKVDLILVDVEMPKETGIELLEWLREKQLPITSIILTGHQRFDYAQQAIVYHAFNYLLKPISKATLNYEIRKALDFVRTKNPVPQDKVDAEATEEPEFVRMVRCFIRNNLADQNLCRDMIADAVNLNPDYLSFTFHKEFGTTLSAYILERRIDHAKCLLKTTELTTGEICERTGFSTISYFSKQFKKVTGVTPQ